jgi:hypothetical protein
MGFWLRHDVWIAYAGREDSSSLLLCCMVKVDVYMRVINRVTEWVNGDVVLDPESYTCGSLVCPSRGYRQAALHSWVLAFMHERL